MKKLLLSLFLLLGIIYTQGQTLDDFSDGDFTANPIWGGNTTAFTIANSDVSTGSTASNTLRLNAAAVTGTDYLSFQKPNPTVWGTAQTWGFWLGRRGQAATAANRGVVWLYASESNLTSATVDGYRITFGDDSGTDEIRLESVTDGVGTTIITSTGSITNGLTDIGFQIRVTRSVTSGWTLYTSTLPTANGSGALATDVLNSTSTSVLQGSVTDATYTTFDNGYLGVAATHSTGGSAIIGQEFDNFKFDVSETATLPISLTSFTGKEANKSIVLNWVTASEKNNKNFEIFRSNDGKNFKSIGTVAGAGDSNAELKYSFVDANPFGGTNYYQLKQIDFDGKSSTSSIIPVDSKIEDTKITVYASSSKVNIGITSPNETSGKLSLFDISGRKISEQNINLNKGYNTLELNDNLNPGIHFITLENEGKVYRQKFVK